MMGKDTKIDKTAKRLDHLQEKLEHRVVETDKAEKRALEIMKELEELKR